MSAEEALQKASAYCSLGERCEQEVRAKLEGWGVEAHEADRIVERLRQERFLDEERFCRAFIADKYRFNKWGRRKIEQALFAKGVPGTVCRPLMDETIDAGEYMENLRCLLEKKSRELKDTNPYVRAGKLLRFAAQRGFLYHEAAAIIGSEADGADG